MRRFLNFLIMLVLVGAILFVGWQARLIPNPFDRTGDPESSPSPAVVSRQELRVAAAERPERLLLESLQRLLQVENLKLDLVEYNPQTVWLELANGEVDVVVAPLGEAVKAQGRFEAGRLLFFSGLSVGLDKLLVGPDTEAPRRVAVAGGSSTDFLARKMLPEASVVTARDASEVEAWLKGKAVEAALVDTSANSAELEKTFKVLTATSRDEPMPTVVMLSKPFAENATAREYTVRREILVASLETWRELVGYLDSQPELLKTTLKKEAQQRGVDVDRLLTGYEFLSPERGRSLLLEFHQQNGFKQTLDLLVLSGVENLSAPDWQAAVESPAFLGPTWAAQPLENVVATWTPTPTPTLTPDPSPTPAETVDSPPNEISSPLIPATYNHPEPGLTSPWPPPVLEQQAPKTLHLAPALSAKALAVAAEDHLYLQSWSKDVVRVPVPSPITTYPLTDGRNFFYATNGRVTGVNSGGKEVWAVEVSGQPLGAPEMSADRLVYAIQGGETGSLICLDPVDGELLWETPLASPPASGPVLCSASTTLVVLLDQTGEIKAWNLADGAPRWSAKLSEPVFLPPAGGHGMLAVNQPNGTVRTFSLEDGTPLWTNDMGTPLAAPPTVTERGVLVPSKDTYLYLLNRAQGSIDWKTRLSQSLSEPAVVVGEKVLQSDESGKVHTLNSTDGALLSSQEMGSEGWLSRVVVAGDRWALVDGRGRSKVFSAAGP